MGCPCGCQDQYSGPTKLEDSISLDGVIQSVENLVNEVYEIGLRDGARSMADVTEALTVEDELENLVEADAVALDAVLARLQDITMRLEAIEMQLGLKYVG